MPTTSLCSVGDPDVAEAQAQYISQARHHSVSKEHRHA